MNNAKVIVIWCEDPVTQRFSQGITRTNRAVVLVQFIVFIRSCHVLLRSSRKAQSVACTLRKGFDGTSRAVTMAFVPNEHQITPSDSLHDRLKCLRLESPIDHNNTSKT